ncbi:MAG: 4-(cytidine 5'-diphospho)-2-C-methyl-D-erythritol kinase [Arcobacteraceae bacterium]
MTKKSYAKVNIFLKIAGKRDTYHELVSRFVRVKNLYDIVSFEKGNFPVFTLEGAFGCSTEQNTIYKAYIKLSELSSSVKLFFNQHKVVVEKNIPEFAGLGGGSSNCATFMIMVNEVCNLGLSKDELSSIGATIGADVPFFIYEYDSANVTGIGEIVKSFEEEVLDIKTFTPDVQCNTGAIFSSFRNKYYKEISKEDSLKLLKMKSKDIYHSLNIDEANDLYKPALENYPELTPENYSLPSKSYFSGSGSSFFYIT